MNDTSNLDRLQELLNEAPKGDRFGDYFTWMLQMKNFLAELQEEAGEQAIRDLKNDLISGGNILDKVNALFPSAIMITSIEIKSTDS